MELCSIEDIYRMEQSTGNKENRETNRQKRRAEAERESYASNKPWWLVIFILVLLAGFMFYIKFLNSPAAKEYRSFWAYLVEPKPTEVLSDSVAAPADDIAVLFGADSATTSTDAGFGDDWAETSPPTATTTPQNDGFAAGSSGASENRPTPPPAASPPPARQGTGFVINAGEFKTKGSAQFRVSELRQGNYPARIVEPASPDGMYKVVVGEYQSESTAQSVARSMGFILEIRTSVEPKR